MKKNGKEYQQKIFFTVVVVVMVLMAAYTLRIPINTGEAETDKLEKNETVESFKQDSLNSGMDGKCVKVHGIYVTGPVAGNQKKMNGLITLADNTPVNAMVIDVKNDSGEITYKMNDKMAEQIGAEKNYITDINMLVNKLKKKNIYLIARIVVFKDPILAERMPKYALKNEDGTVFHDKQGLAWVNPYKKDVWKYVLGIAIQAANAGFDEIQFDYIRFSTDSGMKNVSFGIDEKIVSKQEIITKFTKYAYDILKKKGVCVSADVFGGIISSNSDGKIIGQDYEAMAEYLDFISPMVYPSQFSEGSYGIKRPDNEPYQLVYKALMASNEKLKGIETGANVRPWLQGFTAGWVDHNITYSSNEIADQIKAVYASGHSQWILWNASNDYSGLGLEDLEM